MTHSINVNQLPHLNDEESQHLDMWMFENHNVTQKSLMETAGLRLASFVKSNVTRQQRVICCCGFGNNGADALVAARHLSHEGYRVVILMAPASNTPLKGLLYSQYQAMPNGISDICFWPDAPGLRQDDLILDGLTGTGTHTAPRMPISNLINWINQHSNRTISIDLPSGYSAGLGPRGDTVIHANCTLTFATPKASFLNSEFRTFTGEIWLADIGIPGSVLEALYPGTIAPKYPACGYVSLDYPA